MEDNPLALTFRSLGDRISLLYDALGDEALQELDIRFQRDGVTDHRTYNPPTAAEQLGGILICNSHGEYTFQAGSVEFIPGAVPRGLGDINMPVLARGTTMTHQISPLHNLYYTLAYPMLFMFGEQLWGVDLRMAGAHGESKISFLQYWRFMLQQRCERPTRLLNGGRLLHQLLIDVALTNLAFEMDWTRRNQGKLRAGLYQNVVDAVQHNPNAVGHQLGRRVLPSSYIGSPRNLRQQYLDAMAIVRMRGRPDLFITFTCNPNWREIRENLLPGQQPNDRPDLISRVFYAKLNDLLARIKKGQIFGKVAAVIHVVEFQKRGLPHAHILVILEPEDKIRSPADVDRVVTAELPDRTTHPVLFNRIAQHRCTGPVATRTQRARA